MKGTHLFKITVIMTIVSSASTLAWGYEPPFSAKNITAVMKQATIDVKGILEVIIKDREALDKADIDYVLRSREGNIYYLHFTGKPPEGFETGALITIKKGYLTLRRGNINDVFTDVPNIIVTKPASTTAFPEAFGPQQSIVMLVNFQNAPNDKPYTIQQVRDTIFTTVNNEYYESSYHQTTIVGDVVGWFTIPMNSTDPNCDRIQNDLPVYAEAAATAAGVNLSQYRRRIYIFPKFAACSYAGLGMVGSNSQNWSRAWINGNNSPYVIGHELGHNIGLLHSWRLICQGAVNTGTCTKSEYGDNADMMGSGNLAHFNAFQKDRLGWLNYQNSPPIQTVTASGTYIISPYETFDTNIKALKVAKSVLSNGSTDYYYLEYRQPIGFDSGLNCANCDFTKGVLFHQANNLARWESSYLLDQTPTDGNNFTAALLPGKSFADASAPNGGVTFTVNSVSPTGAIVNVNFGSTPPPICERANQTMTISPTSTIYVAPGGYAYYTVAVKNNDKSNCPASTFNLVATPPSGVVAYLVNPSLTLSPGATGTTTLSVGSTASTPPAVYTVPVKSTSASVPTNTATVNASFGIMTADCVRGNPTITYDPNTTQIIQQNRSVTINFKINNNDSVACTPANFTATTTTNSPLIQSALSNASFTISPGGSATGYMIIKSSNVAVIGTTYSATMTARDATNNRQAAFTSNVLIGNPLHQ